jgi:hypothetical protein
LNWQLGPPSAGATIGPGQASTHTPFSHFFPGLQPHVPPHPSGVSHPAKQLGSQQSTTEPPIQSISLL